MEDNKLELYDWDLEFTEGVKEEEYFDQVPPNEVISSEMFQLKVELKSVGENELSGGKVSKCEIDQGGLDGFVAKRENIEIVNTEEDLFEFETRLGPVVDSDFVMLKFKVENKDGEVVPIEGQEEFSFPIPVVDREKLKLLAKLENVERSLEG